MNENLPNNIPLEEAQFLVNPQELGSYCHCPSIMCSSNGDLWAIWYGYPEEEYSGAKLVLSVKRAGQQEWEKSRIIFEDQKYSAGNPVLVENAQGRVFLYFVLLKGAYWNDAVLFEAWSDDRGFTWSLPVQISSQRGMMVRHAPLICENGAFILGAYDESKRLSVLLTKHPSEEKWEESYRFEGLELIQMSIVKQGEERLTGFFRPCSEPKKIWRTLSNDGGKTWTSPVATQLPNPLSGLAACSVGNAISVIYNHTEAHQRYPLSLSITEDRGVTWKGPLQIDPVPLEVSYPSVVAGKDGYLYGLYTYNRKMIKFVKIRASQIV